MNYCHVTDTTWNPRPLPSRFVEISENYQNSDHAQILKDGWRVAVPATVEAGARYTSAIEFTDTEAREVVTITATAAQVAAEQAAAAAADAAAFQASEIVRKETPLVFDQPVQARLEIVGHDSHVYGLEVDPAAGEIIPVQRESVRLTQAEYEAARKVRLDARKAHRDTLDAIKTELDNVETAMDALNLTATGTTGVAIRATTGTTKAALLAVEDVLKVFKAQVKNLRQAGDKIRREIR
jgi:hypothetical protein